MSGRIFVISGPSGVGKGTLCEWLLKQIPCLRLSISATSRQKRPHEEEGVHYFFKSRSEFEALIAHDAAEPEPTRHYLLEWAEYNGNYYGTPRQAVEEALQAGHDVLLEIDVQGALQVKEKLPQACLIFIAPPSEAELERRLRGRGTNGEEDIQNRLAIARKELALHKHFDHVIVNDTLEACQNTLYALCVG
jgi:guanylate kinase